jgi:hypothetical protein
MDGGVQINTEPAVSTFFFAPIFTILLFEAQKHTTRSIIGWDEKIVDAAVHP